MGNSATCGWDLITDDWQLGQQAIGTHGYPQSCIQALSVDVMLHELVQEIEQLVDEWAPEPLHGELPPEVLNREQPVLER